MISISGHLALFARALPSQVKLLITNNSFSSQVKLQITNNSFCIVQRAAAQSKTGIFRDFGVAEGPPGFQANNAFCIVQRAIAKSKTGFFRDYGVAETPPGFQAGWSDCMYFFLAFCSFCLLIWVFRVSFCTLEDQSLAQMSCREEVGVSFVVLGVLEPQIACHWLRSAAISRHLTNSVEWSLF
jgi:hypothetical protein